MVLKILPVDLSSAGAWSAFIMASWLVATNATSSATTSAQPKYAHEQSPTAAVLADAAAWGLHESVAQGLKTKRIAQAQAACLRRITGAELLPFYKEGLAAILTDDEIRKSDAFLTSPLGLKYIQNEFVSGRLAVGVDPKMPYPTWTQEELWALQLFRDTRVGKMLMSSSGSEVDALKRSVSGKIRSRVEQCSRAR